MKALLCTAVLALATTVIAAEDTKLGAGVTLKEATPISALVDKPADFVGKTVRVDGVATAVCADMGCWLAVSTGEGADAKTVRLKVEDGVIVFPVSAKGKQVSAEGVFELVGTDHAKHDPAAIHDPSKPHTPPPAAAHGAQHAAPAAAHETQHAQVTYQIKATGAIIK
jgi:hypothetical protein